MLGSIICIAGASRSEWRQEHADEGWASSGTERVMEKAKFMVEKQDFESNGGFRGRGKDGNGVSSRVEGGLGIFELK